MNELTFPIIFMVAIVMVEALIIARQKRVSFSWQDVVFNLNSGHIMLWLFRGLELFCYGFVVTHFSFGLTDSWPTWLVWLFTLIAWDLGFYWLHRLHHRYRLLWAVHVVHHQGEHFNLSLGVRNSWYSSLTSIPFFLLLALMGVPLTVFMTISVLHYTIQFFNHSGLIPRFKWLESWMVTPHHHRVHHIKTGGYANRNFGGSFIIWDKLFGTFSESPETPHQYGIGGEAATENPLIDSNRPFLRILGVKKTNKPTHSPRYHIGKMGLVGGTLLLFTLVIGYVYRYGYGFNGTTLEQIGLFLLLAAGTVALSGLSSGYGWGKWSWFTVASLMLLLIIIAGWLTPFWLVVGTLLWLHSAAVLMGVGTTPVDRRDVQA
ncbi:sterol desaturase/sphingolipid hydroxylase (fatty acid hydroxylase superfamily) [Providencia alcalifaciens]|uniref:Sterol desaturase/sphingolipid hydroxylase (Fatty acid hydroxylase superfamily) n=1 Tax=Providencia alcalifaciens TaxID=126385 RepID=A0A4R3NI14_9GAMM|nr:sterol desaturase family protein [Providencia alcalifaciens]TCT34603.1 sterol desaturase/sphingolipid hydroxylase (fatty acid hydroxylase superfamily) [Providencia alcalifaciens]